MVSRMTRDHSGDQDIEGGAVDLLVVGAGAGGMATALVAALEGLSVLVCEKSDQVGGTGSTSAGTLWIPGNNQSKAAGFSDSADDAARYLDAKCTEEELLAPGFGRSELKKLLKKRTYESVMLVGHEPDFSKTIEKLTSARIKLAKAGIALIITIETVTASAPAA